MDPLLTGDIACIQYRKPSVTGRLNRWTTGAVHEHDEMINVRGGGVDALYVHPPRAEYIPFVDREDQVESGKIFMAVYRLTKFIENPVTTAREHARLKMAGAMDTIAFLGIPYDKVGVVSMFRSRIRTQLGPWVKPVAKHVEWKMWCTESGAVVFAAADEYPYAVLGEQPLIHPWHTEQLVRRGVLTLVRDYGLHEQIMNAGPKEQ